MRRLCGTAPDVAAPKGRRAPDGPSAKLSPIAGLGSSQAGFDGDSETRILSWRKSSLRSCQDRGNTQRSCWPAASALVFESGPPIAHVAADPSIHPETLRKRVRQAEADAGPRNELLSSEEREELKRLRGEVRELRRANEILKSASVKASSGLAPGSPCSSKLCRAAPFA